MIQDLNSNPNILDFQQKQMMMMGIQKNQIKLSREEIKKIKQNYVGMFYALAAINWSQGMTLGMAWQKALRQMDAFVASKTKIQNHPMNQYLVKMHTEFRRDMSKTIMTNQYSEEKLNPRLAKCFMAYGTKRVKETKGALNNLYQKYMPKQNVQQKTGINSFDIAKQNIQRMLLQQMVYQHAA